METDLTIEINKSLDELGEGESSLELLVSMAKRGEIDPWDIDLEQVTEKYLKAINDMRGENLREAGKAIFYASVLLRMKSDVLANRLSETLNIGLRDTDDFNALLAEELDFGDEIQDGQQITFRDLERVLRKKNLLKAKRHRKITLADLINALKEAKREEEERMIRRSQLSLFDGSMDGGYIVEPEFSGDILELTHAENLEESIQKTRVFILEYLINGKGIEFNELVKFLNSWSNAFLAIVYLEHEGEVTLVQESFYGDLQIYEPKI